MTLRAALCQTEPSTDISENLERIKRIVSTTDAELFLFPEMYLTRYGNWNFEEYDQTCATDALSDICREYDVAIAMGMAWKEGDRLYNSLVFITPDSCRHYDKLYLANFPPYNEDVFTPGSKPLMVEWRGFKLGLLVCYDVMFPEIHRHYAVHGADAVLMASASALKSRTAILRVIPTRSFENTVYTLVCNNIGDGPAGLFFGNSGIYSPLGDLLSQASDEDQVLVVTLDKKDIEQARRIRHHLVDLRTDIEWE